MRVIHQPGTYISVEMEGVERLRYNYQLPDDPAPSAPRPYCHPIRTPEGIEMTVDAPLDHFWHRGVWFTWKYVKGVNYWEEKQEVVGRQLTLAPPILEPLPDTREGVRWISEIEWRDTGERVDGPEITRLRERRVIELRFDAEDALLMDWYITQTPQEDLLLDRTPFTTWGGYGGLVARMTQALQKQTILLADGTQTDHPVGVPQPWGAIQGQLDTGRDRWAAFLFLPSPRNRRFPEPFYGNARAFYNFFGPAPLFHEPLPLKAGEELEYNARLVILARPLTPEAGTRYYNNWVEHQSK